MSGMREKLAWALASALALLVVAALTGVIEGGDLDPGGPPGPTMKTLQEVEPRTPISALPFNINSPGSYYLTGDLTGSAGSNGIRIDADDVTLELNGFTMRGVPGSLDGVSVTGIRQGLVIRNGAIRNWGAHGINAATPGGLDGAFGARVEDIEVSGNTGDGIRLMADGTVRNCFLIDNLGTSVIRITGRGVVEDCEIRTNVGAGIAMENHGIVRDVLVSNNGGSGIALGGQGSLVVHATSSDNTGHGITVGPHSRVEGSVTSNNDGSGIIVGTDSQVTDSAAVSNDGDGVSAGARTLVENTTANNNTRGIVVVSGVVRGSIARFNTDDGIRATGDTLIVGNEAISNGNGGDGAGIHTLSGGNRIEGNTATFNDRGYDVDAVGNLIIGNVARDNPDNWTSVVAGNALGPIVQTINILTNTNPGANYTP